MVSLCSSPSSDCFIVRKGGLATAAPPPFVHQDGVLSERAKVMSARFYLTPNAIIIRFGRITLLVGAKRRYQISFFALFPSY